MEYSDNEKPISYAFLEIPVVEKHFADLTSKLLAGKHIQIEEYYLYSLLDDYGDHFEFFFEKLYGLHLTSAIHDGSKYYYLEFFESGKGKFTDINRFRALTEIQTIIGLMLLNMYYSKYFENPKIITWSEIRKEILAGELKDKYQRILFEELKNEYTVKEWSNTEKNFKNTINNFHEFGWVKKQFQEGDEIKFEINASIHRLAELYKDELENFTTFSEKLVNWKEE